MSDTTAAYILGLGSYLPRRRLTNRDLESLVDTSDEWIVSRTGMRERRIAAEDESSSWMGAQAARKALTAAKKKEKEVDFILVATMSPDYLCPSTAALIQKELDASQAAVLDIQAACTGYLYALSIAKAFVLAGLYQTILVVATEKMSSFIDYQDRTTCVLFGDGAAAAVVSGESRGLAIEEIILGGDGRFGDLAQIPAGGSKHPASKETIDARQHFFTMDGKEVFRHAIRQMGASAKSCCKKVGISEEEINWLVPHQANLRIIDALGKHLAIPPEKVFTTVQKYGNTSASSVGIALDELTQTHTPSPGERFLLTAFGGGLTWGSALLQAVGGGRR